MSELNAFDITVAEEGYCEGYVKYRRAVYDKSEVDKVIAELRAQIVQADTGCDKALKEKLVEHAALREWAELQLRYQKYKRCLAMAMWCDAEMYAYPSFGTESPKEKWWQKWHNRWLAIAEKFKYKEA